MQYKTVLVGLGQIAAQYADDPAMQETVTYATHAQVLADHPAFSWIAAIDSSSEACAYVQRKWNVETVITSLESLKEKENLEIAVIATPPEIRQSVLEFLPSLKGIIVEKPLGVSLRSSQEFVRECNDRKIKVQVNLTRRSDRIMKDLAKKSLLDRIGKVQAAFGVYGNGLLNNGTHMVDLVRMLIGEIIAVKAILPETGFQEGPIKGDKNFSFLLVLENNVKVLMQPLCFTYYRENSIDIWGEKGRLEILHEGLHFVETPIGPCRSFAEGRELAADKRSIHPTGYGVALYDLYDNLANAVNHDVELESPGTSALRTALVIDSLFRSADQEGQTIYV